MGLKCKIYYTDAQTVGGVLKKEGNAYILSADEMQSVCGVRLTAKDAFPDEFAIYTSTDGENYVLFNAHEYMNYSATPAPQVFVGDAGKIKSVKFVCNAELESAELLVPARTGTEPEKQSGCRSSMAFGVASAVMAVCAAGFVLKRKGD